jgi:hypothetical protein
MARSAAPNRGIPGLLAKVSFFLAAPKGLAAKDLCKHWQSSAKQWVTSELRSRERVQIRIVRFPTNELTHVGS